MNGREGGTGGKKDVDSSVLLIFSGGSSAESVSNVQEKYLRDLVSVFHVQ